MERWVSWENDLRGFMVGGIRGMLGLLGLGFCFVYYSSLFFISIWAILGVFSRGLVRIDLGFRIFWL